MGFQSLLSWISLLGRGRPERGQPVRGVSILVVLDQSARQAMRSINGFDKYVFQSLLSWISLLGRTAWWCASKFRTGFNPCCLGSVCSAGTPEFAEVVAAGFQSLLSWISLLGDNLGKTLVRWVRVSILVVLDQSARRSCRCLPAGGSRVSILVVLDQSARPAEVCHGQGSLPVSILVVLDQSARQCAAAPACFPYLFQSLLSWISLLGCPDILHAQTVFVAFQSLLSWISLLGSRALSGCCTLGWVSILVVLDQSARQVSGLLNAGDRFRFQSLLSWISLLGPHIEFFRVCSVAGFNPCCLGSVCSASASLPSIVGTSCFNPCCLGSVCSASTV